MSFNYQGQGIGTLNPSNTAQGMQLEELMKALSATQLTGLATGANAGGGQLKREDLTGTMSILTAQLEDAYIWNKINSMKMIRKLTNNVGQFNQQASYGDTAVPPWTAEGALPDTSNSDYVRRSEICGILATTRSVTHLFQQVETAGINDAVVEETTRGTLYMIESLDRQIYFGNQGLVQNAFNGIFTQVKNAIGGYTAFQSDGDTVVDLRGAALSQNNVERAARTITDFHGKATDLIAPPSVLSEYAMQFYDSLRTLVDAKSGTKDNAVGYHVLGQHTQTGGFIKFGYDKFFTQRGTQHYGRKLGSSFTALTGAAPVPAFTAAATAAAAAGSLHPAATYRYTVASINSKGESNLAAASAVITVAAGRGATITIAQNQIPNGGGVVIYRTKSGETADDAPVYPIFHLTKAEVAGGINGGGANVVLDLDLNLPDTEYALLMDLSSNQVFEYGLLGSTLNKFALGNIDTSLRFSLLHYGTPFVRAPRKLVIFKNVGRTS